MVMVRSLVSGSLDAPLDPATYWLCDFGKGTFLNPVYERAVKMPVFKGLLGRVSAIMYTEGLAQPGPGQHCLLFAGPNPCWHCVSHLMPSSSRTTLLPLDHAGWAPYFLP